MTHHLPSTRTSITSVQAHARRGDKSFTLVELMTVLLIGLVITAIAIPSISSMMQSLNLNQAGQMLSSQVNLAQQIAGSGGYPVEVRLIGPTSTTNYYTAIQLYCTKGGVPAPVYHPVILPPNAVISGDTKDFSPYLSLLQSATNRPTMAIGGITNSYVSFRISPQGIVTPFAGNFAGLYVSVVPLLTASAGSTNAPNYVTVQVAATTGSQIVYRPGGP